MKVFRVALIAAGLITGSAHAADFSFTGNFSNDDEVQPFNFSVVGSSADVILRTWSFAGGTNAAGTEIARGGFDPIVTLFSAATGIKIDANDDGHLVPDPVTSQPYDSFLLSNLAPGSYTAALTQYANFSAGNLLTDGFQGSSATNFGSRDSHWALDVLNASSASAGVPYISAVPEPETYAMLLAGLGLLAWRTRVGS